MERLIEVAGLKNAEFGPGARGSSEARFFDRLLDAVIDGIERVVPVAALSKSRQVLPPFGQWIEPVEKFAVVLEIHRIKDHWGRLIYWSGGQEHAIVRRRIQTP